MKKNTKKKVLTLTLVIALLAIAVVGGSLAWFTAEDEATNVFTVGSVEIKQNETNADGSEFTQDQPLLPIVNSTDPAADENYIPKIVTVTNTGENPAYVRTHIAVPTALVGYLHLDTKEENWTYEGETAVSGAAVTVFTYRYNFSLSATEETDVLLRGVYLDPKTDVQKNPASGNLEFCSKNAAGEFEFTGVAVKDAEGTAYKVNVLVTTQAVQAEGFADGKTALDSAFGTIPGNVPNFGA